MSPTDRSNTNYHAPIASSGFVASGVTMEALGQSDAFLEFQERIAKAAPIERPVLIIGERGTGKELAAILEKHSWPGNIRELKNVVERAVYRSATPLIESIDLDPLHSPYEVETPTSTAMPLRKKRPAKN